MPRIVFQSSGLFHAAYTRPAMRSPVFWRRSWATVGVYASALLGFLGTVVAVRELGDLRVRTVVDRPGGRRLLPAAADLTIEEALVKYGFRYSERESWGRFRRLFELAAPAQAAGGVIAARC